VSLAFIDGRDFAVTIIGARQALATL